MKLLAVLVLILNATAYAERTEVNKVLFSVMERSWTKRDMQVYNAVLSEVFNKKKITDYSKSEYYDFMVSRIALQEANLFQLSFDKKTLSEADKKKLSAFTKVEIARELELISKAQALIEIKEGQHKDAERFNTWFDLMKRKYSIRLKTQEIK